jgi:hypothetical protein
LVWTPTVWSSIAEAPQGLVTETSAIGDDWAAGTVTWAEPPPLGQLHDPGSKQAEADGNKAKARANNAALEAR